MVFQSGGLRDSGLSVSFPAHHFSLATWVSKFTVTMEDVDVYMKIFFQNHPCVLEAEPRLICLTSDPKSRAQSFD